MRRFLEDGGLDPEDEAMRYCPVCKCKGTVEIPASNKVKARRNEDKLSAYKKTERSGRSSRRVVGWILAAGWDIVGK